MVGWGWAGHHHHRRHHHHCDRCSGSVVLEWDQDQVVMEGMYQSFD
jgi:hypothetical protein